MPMQNIFDRGGLRQTDGEINEIWNQDGRTQVDASASGTAVTVHTVASGKTLYVKSFSWSCTASPGVVTLDDGGTTKEQYLGAQDVTYTFWFDVPLKFSTDVGVGRSGSGTLYCNITGWEE